MFFNEENRHLIKQVKVGNMVYVHPESDLSGGGWAMVMKVSVKDHYGHPNVVEVLYPSGRLAPADEFMITEVRRND